MQRVLRILLLMGVGAGPARGAESAPPRLAVVIVVDQMRADYLTRFAPYYVADGFRRFIEKGTVFENCHYRHSVTKTAPGHASIMTGVFAAQHGIVANEWIDRTSWARVESVEDPASPLVGAEEKAVRSPGGVLEAKTGRSPWRLRAPTLGDVAKEKLGARGRVVAVAKKDRSAILMGGRRPDGAYWLEAGSFVTSRYYRAALPEWVRTFNATDRVAPAFGTVWDRLLPVAEYDKTQGPDDVAGEEPVFGLGRTFPRVLDGGVKQPGKAFYEAYDHSPLNSELLGEFAKAALAGEQLGRHEAPDLFCISFSQVDSCGHNYGPDSHEVMDSMVRLDRVLAGLFAEFDRTVGAGRWVAVLTADHGVAQLPEVLKARDPAADAGRFRGAELDVQVRAALDRQFGPLPAGETWAVRDGLGYHVRPSALAASGVKLAAVVAALKPLIAAAPGVAEVYDRAQVEAAPLDGGTKLAMLRRSYFAARSPDVLFVLRPNWSDRSLLGVNHGLPHDHDTHVPLVWFGAGVPVAHRTERVGVDDLVPTLAGFLGVEPPAGAAGKRLLPRP